MYKLLYTIRSTVEQKLNSRLIKQLYTKKLVHFYQSMRISTIQPQTIILNHNQHFNIVCKSNKSLFTHNYSTDVQKCGCEFNTSQECYTLTISKRRPHTAQLNNCTVLFIKQLYTRITVYFSQRKCKLNCTIRPVSVCACWY